MSSCRCRAALRASLSIEGRHGFAGVPRACGGFGGHFGGPHVVEPLADQAPVRSTLGEGLIDPRAGSLAEEAYLPRPVLGGIEPLTTLRVRLDPDELGDGRSVASHEQLVLRLQQRFRVRPALP